MDFKEVQLVPAKDPTAYQRYRKAILIATFIGVVAVICCVIGILRYTSPKQRLIRAINNSDYEKVSEIQEKNNITLDEKYDSVLNAKISEVNSDFANGKIDFENALSEVSIIKSIGGDNVSSFADLKTNEIICINDSKNAFSKGLEFHGKGDFANAIISFNSVISADLENYTKAQQMIKDDADSYRTALFNTVESKVSENKHEEALSLLLDASDIIPNDQQVSNRISAIQEAIYEQKIDSILAQAETSSKENLLASIQLLQNELPKQNNDTRIKDKLEEYTGEYLDLLMSQVQEYINNEKYDLAITLLNKANSDLQSNPTIKSKLNEIENLKQNKERAETISKDLKEAETIFKEQGYEQAVSFLKSSDYYSSQEIQAAIANYESYKPINLFSMDFWDSNNNVTKVAGPYSIQDNLGNEHPNSYCIYDIAFKTYVTYRIDGQFNHLNGLYFLDYEHRSTSYKGTFTVYGDDDTVLFTTSLEKGMEPVRFSVDISGVKDLKLEYISSAWMADWPEQYYNFSDVTVSK